MKKELEFIFSGVPKLRELKYFLAAFNYKRESFWSVGNYQKILARY